MRVMLRSDSQPDVAIRANKDSEWDYCTVTDLDQQIRTLQVARRWLAKELKRKQTGQ